MCELGAFSLVYPASPQGQTEGSASNEKFLEKYGKPGSLLHECYSYGYTNASNILTQLMQNG